MLHRQSKQRKKPARRGDQRHSALRRRWHALERLETRCVLAATLAGHVFEDLNGDQVWQPSAPHHEPALDCWTVFLDNNKNEVLDEGEPWQLTDAGGSYSFTVSTPGEHAVNLVPEPGYDRTTPIRFGISTTLVEASSQDHVFDPARNVLYTTDGDRVLRTNPKTGESLAAWAFGSSLTAIDITPDGHFLLVGESETFEGTGRLYKVDLSTEAVATIGYSLDGDEKGVFDVAAVSNSRVLFTTASTSPTNAPVPLREVNLATNAITSRTDTFSAGDGVVRPHSRLERNSMRTSLLLAEAHDAAGPVHLYDSSSGAFTNSTDLADSLDDTQLAISPDGTRIAIQSSAMGLRIFDDQLTVVATPTDFQGGIAFDSVRHILYAGDTSTDELVAIDTESWNELYRVAAGEDLPESGIYYEMQVSARAKYLSLTTPTGVRYVQLDRPAPHVVSVTAEQIGASQSIANLDFGNWVNGDNRRPKAISDNYIVNEDATLEISAPGVVGNDFDPDGDSLQSQIIAGPEHGQLSLGADGSFTYSPFGNYFGDDRFEYKAFDGALGSCRAATVHIQVNSVNDAPSDISLSNSSIDENVLGGEIGQVVVVDADVADQFVFQVSDGRFEIANGYLRLKSLVSLDHEQTPTIDLTVTATDTGSPPLSISENFTIQVNDVNEFDPTVETTTIETEEGNPNVGTVQVHDNDSSQTLDITIVGGNGGGIFSIDPNTGVITLNNGQQLDYEGTRIYVVTVSVSDDVEPRRTSTADITITVTDVNDNDPQVQPATFEVAENAPSETAVGTVVATDSDAGQTLTFTITGGNDDGAFAIDSATGAITVADGSALDREQTEQFLLTVQATDNGSPSRSGSAAVTISLLNTNEFDPLVPDASVALDENAPVGSIVTVVSAIDPDATSDLGYSIQSGNTGNAFAIDSQTGEITVADSLSINSEVTQQFVLEILVTDGQSPVRSAIGTVSIEIRDVNEFNPSVNDVSFTVSADASVGDEIGTLPATDDDLTHTLVYSIVSGNDDGIFAIDEFMGTIRIADNTPLTDAGNSQFTLTIDVSDSGTPNRSATADVTITVAPVNEHAPTADDAEFSLDENAAAGSVVGSVSATDLDPGTTLSYSITSGNGGGAFAIDASSGQITVANSSPLNFESTSQFTLTVVVTDNGFPSQSDAATVTIHLDNVNEAPTGIVLDHSSVPEQLPGAVIGAVSVVDPDAGDQHTFDVDDGRFTIDENQLLKLKAGQELDRDTDGTEIPIEITVTDSGGLSLTQQFTIQVGPNPHPWQNPDDPLDVNGDGEITPGDVLQVINEINNPHSTDLNGRLPTDRPDIPNIPFYDVNGDGVVSPIDVLIIINELNRRSIGNQAEGEAGTGEYLDVGAAPKQSPIASSYLLPPVTFEATRRARMTLASHCGEDDLEETLDELAAEIATVWERIV